MNRSRTEDELTFSYVNECSRRQASCEGEPATIKSEEDLECLPLTLTSKHFPSFVQITE
jgi:hypothetical protein